MGKSDEQKAKERTIWIEIIIGVSIIVIGAFIINEGSRIEEFFLENSQSDFSLLVEPIRGSVTQGEMINTRIVLKNLGGTKYKGNITLVANLLNRSDVKEIPFFTFNPNIMNIENRDIQNSTMSIKAGMGLSPGTYEIEIKGKSQEEEKKNSYILDVIPNYPPNITTLTPDKLSPQYSGTDITWTAAANDAEDNILYKFWLKGLETSNKWEMKQDWSSNNTWVWKTKWDMPEAKYPYDIKVSVRDGKHSSEEGEDSSFEVSDYYLRSPPLEVKIQNPSPYSEVPGQIMVSGTISRPLGEGRHMWILVAPSWTNDQWWPQGGGQIIPRNGHWQGAAWIGVPEDSGKELYIAIISVNEEDHKYLVDDKPTNMPFPASAETLGEVTVVRE